MGGVLGFFSLKFHPKVRMELGTVDLAIVSAVMERFPGPSHSKSDLDRDRALTRRAHPRSSPIRADTRRLDHLRLTLALQWVNDVQ